MANEIAKANSSTELSTDLASRWMRGIAEARSVSVLAGGKPLLRLDRNGGGWVYGQANDEVEKGSYWAINIMTLEHGWACWVRDGKGKNTLAGEPMASMLKPRPPRPDPIEGTEFQEQKSFNLRCISGEAEGLEVAHKMTSYGGRKAIDALLAAIEEQLSRDPVHPCPVVVLEFDSYKNEKYGGKTYFPIYNIVGWVDMDGNAAEPEKPAVMATKREEPFPFDAMDAKQPKVRTRQTPPSPPDPVPTAQLHTGQRRRPIAR